MSINDLNNLAIKHDIYLNDNELNNAYKLIKDNYLNIIDNPDNYDINNYKNYFTNDNYIKINNLINIYKSKYNI